MELDGSVMLKGQEHHKSAGLVGTYLEIDTLFVKPIEEQMFEQAENSWESSENCSLGKREIRQLTNLH